MTSWHTQFLKKYQCCIRNTINAVPKQGSCSLQPFKYLIRITLPSAMLFTLFYSCLFLCICFSKCNCVFLIGRTVQIKNMINKHFTDERQKNMMFVNYLLWIYDEKPIQQGDRVICFLFLHFVVLHNLCSTSASFTTPSSSSSSWGLIQQEYSICLFFLHTARCVFRSFKAGFLRRVQWSWACELFTEGRTMFTSELTEFSVSIMKLMFP